MAALGWILRESNKGGYLPPLFFLLQFHESSWKCFFLGFKYILLKRKYAFQSLNWSMRAECLGRWPLCCWGLSQWTSGRPSSSGMQYTTCLGSPCHTPCDISCPLPSAFCTIQKRNYLLSGKVQWVFYNGFTALNLHGKVLENMVGLLPPSM